MLSGSTPNRPSRSPSRRYSRFADTTFRGLTTSCCSPDSSASTTMPQPSSSKRSPLPLGGRDALRRDGGQPRPRRRDPRSRRRTELGNDARRRCANSPATSRVGNRAPPSQSGGQPVVTPASAGSRHLIKPSGPRPGPARLPSTTGATPTTLNLVRKRLPTGSCFGGSPGGRRGAGSLRSLSPLTSALRGV